LKVVLVHGLTASTAWWEPTIAALEPRHDVHVVQLPRLRIREAARWLAARLEEEELQGAAVVGHSSGGTIAVLAAAQAQEAVGRLVLLAPAGIFPSRSRLAFAVPLAVQVLRAPRRLPHMIRDSLRIGPLRLWLIASDLLSVDVAPTLPEIQAPALVLWGADDPLLSPALGRVFAEQIPDARLVILPECGHIPMLERPAELHRELLGFLG
jgi:2-hydroxy-6-oxonona-2,4-dienedioate hydrolase